MYSPEIKDDRMTGNHYKKYSKISFQLRRGRIKQYFLAICVLVILLIQVYTNRLLAGLMITLIGTLASIFGFLIAVVAGLVYHELKWNLDADSAWIPERASFSGLSLQLEIISALLFPSQRFRILVIILSIITWVFFLSIGLKLFIFV